MPVATTTITITINQETITQMILPLRQPYHWAQNERTTFSVSLTSGALDQDPFNS
jgi:hypothetical protein